MTLDEMKQVVREQKAGYEAVRRLNIEDARRATFADRLSGLRQILNFSEHLPARPARPIDEELTQKWIRIRERYAERER